MNIFTMPMEKNTEELCEELLTRSNIKIERIISWGQSSPEGFWYDQEWNEWVVLLQGHAQLSWDDGILTELRGGDQLFIPAHKKHRVKSTSSHPPCIWLAVHFTD